MWCGCILLRGTPYVNHDVSGFQAKSLLNCSFLRVITSYVMRPADRCLHYFEQVYNEQIRDLLRPMDFLPLREDPQMGVIIKGLSLHKLHTAQELLHMLQFGNTNRTQHPTDANAESSRSHAVFQVGVNAFSVQGSKLMKSNYRSFCPDIYTDLHHVILCIERNWSWNKRVWKHGSLLLPPHSSPILEVLTLQSAVCCC